MKKVLLLFAVMAILIPLHSVHTQTLMDYVLAQRGDTLVIKDYADMGNESNSLYKVLVLDTNNVPAGRVYELQAGGWYPLDNNPITSAKHPTVIVGSDTTMVVNNKNANSAPPLICGFSGATSSNAGGINAGSDLTINNCALIPAADDSTLGWSFTGTTAPNLHLVFDNCIMERTRWIFVGAFNRDCNVTFRNCYFANMNGQPSRFNGGVFDCYADQDTLLVENCTFINAQSDLFKFRTYSFRRIIFNHNTFINCAGPVISNNGNQTDVSVTNNIFINCNVQPFSANNMYDCDCGNPDPDLLPMGLVNVNPYALDSLNNPIRRYYVDRNLVYWDPFLSNIVDTVNALAVSGYNDWQSQMITMNSRTQQMFDNDSEYPCLTEGVWFKEKSNFTDSKNLFTTQLAPLKVYAIAAIDTSILGTILPDWRLVNTGAGNFVHPDWPIPVDLSYSNTDLLTGGISAFPIGDLNWFPNKKTEWLAQRSLEYSNIQWMLDHSPVIFVAEKESLTSGKFILEQNYPNPFNPNTTISFSIPKAGYVTLKVYDILGQEMQSLVNERENAGNHSVTFNVSNLPTGVYFYRLQAGNYSAAKKLVILK